MRGRQAVRGISRDFLAKHKTVCTHRSLLLLMCSVLLQRIITVYFRRGSTLAVVHDPSLRICRCLTTEQNAYHFPVDLAIFAFEPWVLDNFTQKSSSPEPETSPHPTHETGGGEGNPQIEEGKVVKGRRPEESRLDRLV